MAINKVDLTVSQLLEDLNEGYTWLKKDDLGYGSIETKYGANEKQITTIRKHPALKNAETSITIFNIIDDTKDGSKNTTTQEPIFTRTNSSMEPSNMGMVAENKAMVDSEAADIFANL